MILITVNNNQYQFSETLTVQNLVKKLNIQTKGIALAINSNVIKKENWSSHIINNNDTILIIKSTQGG